MTYNSLKLAISKGEKLYFGKHKIYEIDIKSYEKKYDRVAIKALSYGGFAKFWVGLSSIKKSIYKKK